MNKNKQTKQTKNNDSILKEKITLIQKPNFFF